VRNFLRRLRIWLLDLRCPVCSLELVDEAGSAIHCVERHYVRIEIPMQGGGLCKIERYDEDAEENLFVYGHESCDHGIVGYV